MGGITKGSPVRSGAIGLVVVAAVVLAAFNVENLRFLGSSTVSAHFAEAAGLRAGDEVRVAGTRVGQVRAVELDDAVVRVDFTVDHEVPLGDTSHASIGVATVLGERYVKLEPAGAAPLDGPIVLERTTVPYQLPEVLADVTRTAEELDTERLSLALDSVSETLVATQPDLAAALDGVTRLSRTISSRDQALGDLLRSAEGVSGVLADRSDQLVLLVSDANRLLEELQVRRDAVEALLTDVATFSEQLAGIVSDNRDTLGPALDRTNRILEMLHEERDRVAEVLEGVGIYATSLGESVASGPFFNAYLQNLVPGNLVPDVALPDVLPVPSPGGDR